MQSRKVFCIKNIIYRLYKYCKSIFFLISHPSYEVPISKTSHFKTFKHVYYNAHITQLDIDFQVTNGISKEISLILNSLIIYARY